MKNIFKLLIVGGAVAFSMSSCEDLLETTPKQAITPGQAFSDLSGYEGILGSAYQRSHAFGYYGQQMMVDPEILADNLVIVNRTGRFVGEFDNAFGAHIGIWGIYDIINEVNIVIDGVDEMEGDQEFKNQLKGEALFLRALTYHNLLRTYSYEPGMEVNGFNLGVILRTEPTMQLTDADLRSRSTNLEGYQLVEQDLKEAISLLPANVDGPYRANKTAANALLSRVYLYWGKCAEAEAAATAALTDNPNAVLVDSANYVNSFAMTPHPESIFELDIKKPDWSTVDGINNSLQSMTSKKNGGQFVVAGSPELIESIEEGDVRREVWKKVTEGGQEVFQSLKWPGEKGSFLENIPVIRYAEVLLIRAEARATCGNETGAIADINTLRASRGLDDIEEGISGTALIDAILHERRVELALEGHRWYDLKRLGRDITKPAAAVNERVPYTSPLILAPIPFEQIRINENLTQNPGY